MKFNVVGKEFQQQLQTVSRVVNAKNPLTILDNFLLQVEGDVLKITGSDQENMLSASMEITDSEGDGQVAVSARRLLEITKEISGQPLQINVNDETKEIDIKFLNGHFNFMGIDGAEYPTRRELSDAAAKVAVPASVISLGIENTLYAVSQEPVRPIMTGILWDFHNEDITFVGSDTHKLVRYINRQSAPGLEASFIMPAKPANILRSLMPKEEGNVEITFDDKGACFKIGAYELSCVFVKGTYPNYNRVIPAESPFELTVDRVSLLNALRRVTLFTAKSSNLVVVNVQPNEMLLSGQDLDYATKADERVACNYEGKVMTLGFNGAYMIEVLGNMKCDTIVLHLTDPARPGVYTPQEQPEGQELLVIQMPMQVY